LSEWLESRLAAACASSKLIEAAFLVAQTSVCGFEIRAVKTHRLKSVLLAYVSCQP